jgi:hypothetical protein
MSLQSILSGAASEAAGHSGIFDIAINGQAPLRVADHDGPGTIPLAKAVDGGTGKWMYDQTAKSFGFDPAAARHNPKQHGQILGRLGATLDRLIAQEKAGHGGSGIAAQYSNFRSALGVETRTAERGELATVSQSHLATIRANYPGSAVAYDAMIARGKADTAAMAARGAAAVDAHETQLAAIAAIPVVLAGSAIAVPFVATAAGGGTVGAAVSGGVTAVPVGATLRTAAGGSNSAATASTDFAGGAVGGAVISKAAPIIVPYVGKAVAGASDKLIGKGFVEGIEKAVPDIAASKVAGDLVVVERLRTVGAAEGLGFNSGLFRVGPFNEIQGKVLGLDAHHVGQKALLGDLIPGYNPLTGPSILVPKVGHTIRHLERGIVSRSVEGLTTPRSVLARDIIELRRVYRDIPNSQLQELIRFNKTTYPQSFRK